MEQLLEQFFEHLRYERNVSEHTLRNYRIDLGQFHDHLAPADPQTGKRREFDIKQIDHITIREWLSELHAANKQKSSIARNLAKMVSTPRLEKKLPTHLSVEEMVRFIETPDTTTGLGKRDRAILEMLYGTGMRVSELTKLNLRDIDLKERMVRVTGKRRKQRVIPMTEPALDALVDYLLNARQPFLGNAPATERDEQAVFLNYQGT